MDKIAFADSVVADEKAAFDDGTQGFAIQVGIVENVEDFFANFGKLAFAADADDSESAKSNNEDFAEGVAERV